MWKRKLFAGFLALLMVGNICSYADSEEEEDEEVEIVELKKDVVEKGDYVEFGQYVLKADSEKKENLQWQVLEVDDDKALLITRYCIRMSPYCTELPEEDEEEEEDERDGVFWEDSLVRTWLNMDVGDGFLTSFSEKEADRILKTDLTNEDGGHHGETIRGGNDTTDKVFVLSVSEAKDYMPHKADRKAKVIEACEEDADEISEISELTDTVHWWLREPGDDTALVKCIGPEGSIVKAGFSAARPLGVRPVMWVKLK